MPPLYPKTRSLHGSVKKYIFFILLFINGLFSSRGLLAAPAPFSSGPVITSFSPHSGAVGSTVTITGNNFNSIPGNNIVYFGSIRATLLSATPTTLTVVTPVGASYQPISVSSNNATAYTDGPFTVTFAGAGPTFTPSSFGTKIDNATNRMPSATAAADLDGDGRVDAVVVNSFDWNISVYRNRTTGGTLFFQKADFPASTGAVNVTLGDLNGDGLPDMVVVNNAGGGSSVSVYKNTSSAGSISFAGRADYGTGKNSYSAPQAVVIADLDGDGRPDLAIANEDNTMTVLSNSGTGGTINFVLNGNYPIGPGARSLAAADLDGDGRPDIIVANSSSNYVSIFQNTSIAGHISFAPAVSYTTGSGPTGVAIGDLDGDGKPDFAVVNANDYTLTLFRNTGAGGVISFADSVAYSTRPNYAVGLVITDLDGDGMADIAVTNSSPQYINGTNIYGVLAFKNTGKPGALSLAPAMTYATGNGLSGICIADITGDGLPDLVSANLSDNTFSVLPNWTNAPHISSFTPIRGGKGTIVTITGSNFTNITSVSIGGQPVTSYTVNSSSSITATVAQALGGSVVVNSSHGTGSLPGYIFYTLPTVNSFTPATGPEGATITVIGSNFDPVAGNNSVYLGSVKGIVTAATANTLTVKVPGGSSYQPLQVYADGRAAFPAQPFVLTWPGGGFIDSTSFSSRTDYPVGVTPVGFTFGDLDGDGYPDLVATNNGTGITVYHNKATTDSLRFDTGTGYATGSSPVSAVIADVDGDGKPDILVNNILSHTISVFRNTSTPGNISFAPKVDISNAYASHMAIADIDGDGMPDIVAVNQASNGYFYIFLNTSTVGNISFAMQNGGSTGSNPAGLAVGILDGDGMPDIAIVNSADNTVSLFQNTSQYGMISFAGFPTLPTPGGPVSISMGDLDGDGKPDLAIANINSAAISVFQNTSTIGSLSFATRVDYGCDAHPSVISIGDLDGDGKPDLAALSNSNTVSVYKNYSANGSLSFSSKTDYPAANSPEGIFIGDLHNAGINDLATVNEGANSVSIFRYKPSNRPAPVISSFSPDSAGSGSTVTIKGNYLSAASSVRFGALPAASFTVISDTVLTAIVDTGATGSIIVKTPFGSDTLAGFTYLRSSTPPVIPPPVVAPVINSFAPTRAGKGDTVTIRGSHFTGTKAVSFGSIPASSFIVVSDSLLTAIVDTGASGSLIVTGPNGADTLAGFTFITPSTPPVVPPPVVAPVINSFAPTRAGKGDTVTIRGSHLTGIKAVSFGSIPASSFMIVSDSLLTAIVDTGASGSLILAGPNGSDTLAGFTFINPPPVITPPIVTPPAPAVFQLKEFTGSLVANQAYLQWKIADDSSISYYVVEQSTDTVHFNPVSSIKARGVDTASYTLLDLAPRTGVNYYLLKIEDTAGKTRISNIVTIQGAGTPVTLSMHPNPATGYIQVTLPSTINPSQFQLVDMNGKIMQITPVAKGVTDVRIDLASFINGVYKLIWSDGANYSYQTILIMKK